MRIELTPDEAEICMYALSAYEQENKNFLEARKRMFSYGMAPEPEQLRHSISDINELYNKFKDRIITYLAS